MHEMKLQDSPFQRMALGYKIIEMRLNDEKRQKIKIKDRIKFINILTNEELIVEVLDLHHFSNFIELYDHFDKVSLGYQENEEASPLDMQNYYTQDEIDKYGVLGIEVLVI